jgi:hypothetical protein
MAGEKPLRSRISPPLDVPSAPPRSSTDSRAMPRARIAAHRLERSRLGAGITHGFSRLREGLAVGLLDILSRDSATRSRQRRLGCRGTVVWPEFEVPVATRFEQDYRVCSKRLTRSGSRKPPANPAASCVTAPRSGHSRLESDLTDPAALQSLELADGYSERSAATGSILVARRPGP